jgi:hypothetical protein
MVDLMPPYLTRILIDDVLTSQAHVSWLGWLVLSLLGLQIVRVTITISDALLTNRISTSFAAGVREKMFAHLKLLLAGVLRPQRDRSPADPHQPGYRRAAGSDQPDVQLLALCRPGHWHRCRLVLYGAFAWPVRSRSGAVCHGRHPLLPPPHEPPLSAATGSRAGVSTRC